MESVNPLIAAPAILWTIIGGVCILASIFVSMRGGRGQENGSWNPFSSDYLIHVGAAALGYLATAIPLDRANAGSAFFTALLAAMMASAFDFLVLRGRQHWPPLLYAVSGGALYGAMPL
ncbi:hypothetical protein [Streptomyces sp. NL15-2K]|uniref:hypothetical protein n=1 Tax=Streptomyces sp. NL15-2K TaxID=376149 RepID=UPI000F55BA1B|nr:MULTISPECIES: hypothetical protein [Actinomycetes]WKX08500.1 hypothetical protein Q4V64_13790 [Kutzneria buriramensis]